MSEATSRVPAPSPVRIKADSAAVLVLDLTLFGGRTNPHHEHVLPQLSEFLDRARAARVPIVFTGVSIQAGQPVEPALHRREDEPLIYPAAYDKFKTGELRALLHPHGVKEVIITGGAANMAVMYTATAAARDENYQVYIPLDGVYTPDAYRYEYAMYQLTVLPGGITMPRFTTLRDITFV
jgi:nicotinamidase-related amidase